MKKVLLHTVFIFIACLNSLGQSLSDSSAQVYEAGTPISINFNDIKKPTPMYCSNSYYNTLVEPIVHNGEIKYVIPPFMTKKTGWLEWQLTKKHKTKKGKIKITPVNYTEKLETYLGPPSVKTGYDDHAMLVTIPTDSLNNPLAPNTPVVVKKSWKNTESTSSVYTDGLYAYEYIESSTQVGRALITTECLNLTSKELSLEILPSPPTNFTIDYDRIHSYADGNQITRFYSSTIKDMYGNIVADGTLVNFIIKNKDGNLLQTQGVTIRGVATCQMVHPDHKESWDIHAFVDLFSQSNHISINYKQAVKDYNISYDSSEKIIIVGPIKSFMKQILPDGLIIHFTILEQDKLIRKATLQSEKGFANLKLKNLLQPNTNYTIIVEAAEIQKQLQIKN